MNEHNLKTNLVSARSRRIAGGLAITAILSVAAALGGCGGGAGSYCESARNCEGGNQADEDACNIVADEEAQLADSRNCSTEYDDYFNCVYDNARCNNKSYGPDDKTCADQADRYNKCIQ